MRSLIFAIMVIILLAGCHSNDVMTKTSTDPESAKKEVAQAEESMFNAIRQNDPGFWRTVSDSYISINADGVMANKEQTIADSARRNLFTGIDHRLFDHSIRVFGDVGICTGRAQFFMKSLMVAEVYYTALFRKDKGKWVYEGWQGTMTKNNPKQPG